MRERLTYANVAATAALFLAVAGGTTAIALQGKNTVRSDDIAPKNVRTSDLANRSVIPAKLKKIPAVRAEYVCASGALLACITGPGQDIPSTQCCDSVAFRNEAYDTAKMHSADLAKRTKLKAPRSGIYQVQARLSWTGANGYTEMYLVVNNGAEGYLAADYTDDGLDWQELSAPVALKKGDYVEVQVGGSGPNLAVGEGADNFVRTSFFAMHWIAPLK